MSSRPWAENLSGEEKVQAGLFALGVCGVTALCVVAPQVGIPVAIGAAYGFFKAAIKGGDPVAGAVGGAISGGIGATVPAETHPVGHIVATTAGGAAASIIQEKNPVEGAFDGAVTGLTGTLTAYVSPINELAGE